jgi:hypothetical protein
MSEAGASAATSPTEPPEETGGAAATDHNQTRPYRRHPQTMEDMEAMQSALS